MCSHPMSEGTILDCSHYFGIVSARCEARFHFVSTELMWKEDETHTDSPISLDRERESETTAFSHSLSPWNEKVKHTPSLHFHLIRTTGRSSSYLAHPEEQRKLQTPTS